MAELMFLELVLIYLSIVLGAWVSTFVLIVTGHSWGRLPHLYLQILSFIQERFPRVYPKDDIDERWPSVISKPHWTRMSKSSPNSREQFVFLSKTDEKLASQSEPERIFDMTATLAGAGLSAIVQDDLSSAFDMAPTYVETLNGLRPQPVWSLPQKIVFYLGMAVRLLLLFPVRVLLFATTFAWTMVACVYVLFYPLSPTQRVFISVVYCRLFSAAMGYIGIHSHQQHRPSSKSIAVANHLSPNDLQHLFSDMPIDGDFGYTITGQRHTGIIGTIQKLTSRICPALWLDRASQNERAQFTNAVMAACQTNDPVLFFPEGYCTNNTQVLQFRRAVFVENVDIYPIAIRQEARFGDCFWAEDHFPDYLLRMLTSWAVVYHVDYLPRQRRRRSETASEFAARVHDLIADRAGLHPGIFDGVLWYKKSEKERLLKIQQEQLSERLFTNTRSFSGEDKENQVVARKPILVY